MRDADVLCKAFNIYFASPEFLYDANAIGMGKNSEEFGELFTD
jgi:hypothetical protein